jgi:DNA-binding NarL/FixJ family response regulator
LKLNQIQPIRILLADDHPVVVDSLQMLLESIEGFEVVATVNNGWQALNFIEQNKVDILMADLHMPLLNGIHTIHKLKETKSATKTIILTMSEEPDHIKDAIQAGAKGYVMKSAGRNELIEAIKMVAKGEQYFGTSVVNKLAELDSEESPTGKSRLEDIENLTRREIEIIKLVAEDLSNLEIGESLGISIATVETHRRNLMKKLGLSTAVGLVRWGLKNGLVGK